MNTLLNQILESVVEEVSNRVVVKVQDALAAQISKAVEEHLKKNPANITSEDIRRNIIELVDNDDNVRDSITELVETMDLVQDNDLESKVTDIVENMEFNVSVRG